MKPRRVQEQLYSTASYKAKDLERIGLLYNDLSGWDFSGQNLQHVVWQTPDASFNVILRDANFSGADTRGGFGAHNRDEVNWSNTIRHDGTITGLHLTSDPLTVRNYQAACEECDLVPVTIMEQMTVAEGGALELRFDADPWNSTISFQAGIPVTLGGTLELAFADDVNVATQVGRKLRIFDWTGVSPTGAFTVSSPYTWNLSKLYTTGEVTLTAVPEPAGIAMVLISMLPAIAARRRRV